MNVDTGNSGEGRYRIVAEINMIPLIDVSLVLLIIFMVMTPIMVKSQLKVLTPEAKTAESVSSQDLLEVAVDETGAIEFNGRKLQAAELEAVLLSRVTDPEKQSVLIHADHRAKVEALVGALDAARKAGLHRVGIGVKPQAGTTVTPAGGAGRSPVKTTPPKPEPRRPAGGGTRLLNP